jgi:deoxyribonuclease-4
MSAKLVGAHMSTSKGLASAVRSGHAMGCTAIQVFTSSPQRWHSPPVTEAMADDFRLAQRETGLTHVVCHDSYLINLCAIEPEMREKSIRGMIGEVERCALYGIPYVVSHMGAHKGQGVDWGLGGVAESLARVLQETPDCVTVLMETTAGQGSCLMSRFEELAKVLEIMDGHERIGICLDTCHVFVAGYDIRDAESFDRTFDEFDKLIGLSRLKVIHCNDSKRGLGSRVDRHEHIGAGEIGEEAFRILMNDERFTNIPILIETDGDDDGHERDLAKLRSLQARPVGEII